MGFTRLISVSLVAAALLLLPVMSVMAGSVPKPGAKDKCSVCGMFVARYPEWVAAITLKNGTVRYFDGVKDLLKFYQSPERYGGKGDSPPTMAISVKDYYSLEFIDGRAAFYVLGSDVLGPMGKELIPFAKEADAAEFLRDHRGSRVLRFRELTPAILRQLE